MKRAVAILAFLSLSACGGGAAERDEVSRAEISSPRGLTYEQFKDHSMNDSDRHDSLARQKRFLALDRDNNGVLTEDEAGGP